MRSSKLSSILVQITPAGLATSSYVAEHGAERWAAELLYGHHKPHLSGIRGWETAQMGTTNGLCLSRLQLTNNETDPAAISASTQTQRTIRLLTPD